MLVSAGWTGTSVRLMGAQAFSLESDLTISNKLKKTLHFWPSSSTSRILSRPRLILGLPQRLSGKESTCNTGDVSSIPGLGRSPGEGTSNPLQCSCLENPRDRGAWWATVHMVTESQTQLSKLKNNTSNIRVYPYTHIYKAISHSAFLVAKMRLLFQVPADHPSNHHLALLGKM